MLLSSWITIDKYLNFEAHLDSLAKKLSRAVGILAKVRHYVQKQTLINIYYSIFNSHLIYGTQNWIHGNNEKINKIQTLQNKAIKIISFAQARTPAKPLLKNLSIVSLRDYNMIQNCLLVHDVLNRNIPEPFIGFFEINQNPHSTRSATRTLKVNRTNTILYGTKSVTASCESDWNNSITKFKINSNEITRSMLKRTLTEKILKKYE